MQAQRAQTLRAIAADTLRRSLPERLHSLPSDVCVRRWLNLAVAVAVAEVGLVI
jgi:hypothetical protein